MNYISFFVRGLNSPLTVKNEDTTLYFFELFGDRGQLSLGPVFFQYLPDLGGKLLYGIDLGLAFNFGGIIFFAIYLNFRTPYLR